DGSVEVLACGNHDAVTALCDWLWQGSPQAKVRDVHCREVAWQVFDDFGSR
ncbi:MAG: acylphosphatase, partial [Gammaproteobacteria bacterium]